MDEQEYQQQQPPTEEILSLIAESVEVKIKDMSGQVQTYTLRDISGDERDAYIDMQVARLRYGPDGTPGGIKSMAGLMAKLVSLCLYDPTGKRVDEKEVKKFPSALQSVLFQKAKTLCGLDDLAKEKAKNS